MMEKTMANCLCIDNAKRIGLKAVAFVLYTIIALFGLVFGVAMAFLFCSTLVAGTLSGPDFVVAPFLAAVGFYLFIEAARELTHAWRLH